MKNKQQSQQNLQKITFEQCSSSSNDKQKLKSEPIQINVNKILTELLQFNQEMPGKMADINEEEIYGIANKVKDIFQKEQALLELTAPLNICGDIHGQYYDLLRIFGYGGIPPNVTYLFLGDYVDRGQFGIETILLLFCLKISYPNKIYLLRGNHQTASITKIYGFYNECKKRYNIHLWKCFLATFSHLPIAAVIEEKIICMHGGLSPHMRNINEINSITRPTEVPDQGLLCDLLWADPTTHTPHWAESQRGCSYVFGCDVTSMFLKSNDLDLVCRAHQVVQDGYQFCHKKKVVTLFSAPNYCREFDNAAAFMKIDVNLRCQFKILKPSEKIKPFKNSKPKVSDTIVIQ